MRPFGSTGVRAAGEDVPSGQRGPLPLGAAWRNVLRCAVHCVGLLLRRQTHLRRELVGTRLHFADGTSSDIFRETTADVAETADPCLLFVTFRLRLLHGRWHKLFLWECILNTPLFVGFPGFTSKLWLNVDEKDRYRGFYEWSDPASAEQYAKSLWRVLELVCTPGSIDYAIIPGLRRAAVFDDPTVLEPFDASGAAWWRMAPTTPISA